MCSLPSRVERLATDLVRRLEHRWIAVLGTLTLVGVSASVLAANAKPFWHDEIFTILVAGLPSLPAIWRAELDGVDFFPPLNDFLTHGLGLMFGVGPIVTRLPAIMSFWAASFLVFEMVRRRSSLTAALSAFMLLFFTASFTYSYEARGYSPMLVLFAASLFAWSEAARGHRRRLYLPLFAIALAASVWNHYFAVLTLLPLAAGEVVRLARSRRPDWGMYAAVAVAGVLVLPLLPLMRAAAGAAPPPVRFEGFFVLIDTYRFLIGFLVARRFLALAAVLIAVALLSRGSGGVPARSRGQLPAHEIAAGLMCLLMPTGAMLLGEANGAPYNRYALPFTVGLAVIVPVAMWRISPNAIGEALMGAVFAASFAQLALPALLNAPLARPQPLMSRPVLEAHLQGAEPIVLTGIEYLQMWYYAPPELRGRLWYIADPESALETFGTGTMDRNLLALRGHAPVTVVDYKSFVTSVPRFLVLTKREGHWLLQRLERDGGNLTQIGSDSGVPIYDVSFNDETPARVGR
jgi:hypothetical protein